MIDIEVGKHSKVVGKLLSPRPVLGANCPAELEILAQLVANHDRQLMNAAIRAARVGLPVLIVVGLPVVHVVKSDIIVACSLAFLVASFLTAPTFHNISSLICRLSLYRASVRCGVKIDQSFLRFTTLALLWVVWSLPLAIAIIFALALRWIPVAPVLIGLVVLALLLIWDTTFLRSRTERSPN